VPVPIDNLPYIICNKEASEVFGQGEGLKANSLKLKGKNNNHRTKNKLPLLQNEGQASGFDKNRQPVKGNPSVTGAPVQTLLWPGGSGGARRKHRPGVGRDSKKTLFIRNGRREALAPAPLREEITASWFQASRPGPQARDLLAEGRSFIHSERPPVTEWLQSKRLSPCGMGSSIGNILPNNPKRNKKSDLTPKSFLQILINRTFES